MSEDLSDIRLGETIQDPIGELPMPWAYGVIPWGNPSDSKLVVFLMPSAFMTVVKHGQSDLYREVGGVLVGDVYFCPQAEKNYTVIEAAIPATLAAGSRTNVILDHDAWSLVLTEKQNLYPHQRIIGWYHTHPGLGIFLSPDDDFWHHTAFPNFWQVSMVYDPVANIGAFYAWTGNNIELVNGFYELLPRGQKFSSVGKVSMTWEFQKTRERPPSARSAKHGITYALNEPLVSMPRAVKMHNTGGMPASKNSQQVRATPAQPEAAKQVSGEREKERQLSGLSIWIWISLIAFFLVLLVCMSIIVWYYFEHSSIQTDMSDNASQSVQMGK